MKKIILPILLFISLTNYSQNINSTELTSEEIKFLAQDIITFIGEPNNEDYENSIKNNLVNYEFHILYNDSLIYRGAIKKPSLSDINSNINRKNTAFCLEYDIFDTVTKLELAENKKLKINQNQEGKKFYWTDDYELFKIDKYKGLIVNDKLTENIKIKFYKN
jgi:hypothetical protein